MPFAQSDTPEITEVGDRLLGASWEQWLTAGIVVVVAFVVGRLLRSGIQRVLAKDGTASFGARLLGRIVMYGVVVFGLVYSLGSLDVPLGPLFGVLGVAGLALALAFQDILGNFLAGVVLMLRRPFDVGDQIHTAGYDGSVEDVNLRATRIRQYDGTIVFIPNSTVLDNPIVNNTARGARRTTFDIGVSYDADLDHARQVILETLGRIDGVRDDPAPQAYVHEMGDSSINFAVRYWHAPRIADTWEVRDEVARALKRRFDDAGIEIPFPQRVLHLSTADATLTVNRPSDGGSGR